jgi:hypothetical protein
MILLGRPLIRNNQLSGRIVVDITILGLGLVTSESSKVHWPLHLIS